MRVDLALKYLCLARSRSLVKSLCEDDLLRINGRPAKPSTSLHPDDVVSITSPNGVTTIVVLEIPQRQMSKADAAGCYRVVDGDAS